MRQVFRSQRLENVETAANLLRKEGIAVKIENGRSWRGHRRGNFSYDLRKARDPDSLPTLWIVNADDQPRARQLLRELGLLETTRASDVDALPGDRFEFQPGSGANRPGLRRWRLGLVVAIAVVLGLIVFLPRPKPTPATAPARAQAPSPPIPEAITETTVFRMDMPKALAAALIRNAAAEHSADTVCAQVEGREPAVETVQQLTEAGITALPAAACSTSAALRVEVANYMTDGSGSGEVQVRAGDGPPAQWQVQREGRAWQVHASR